MVWAGKGKTAVVGIGMSKLVRHSEKSLGMLALEACKAAIEDAGLKASDIDGVVTYPDQPFRGAGSRDGEDLVTAQFMMNNGSQPITVEAVNVGETGHARDLGASRRRRRTCASAARR